MVLSLAPMEGITGHVFRRAHADVFGALDRYYTPFICPPRVGSGFGRRASEEIDPQVNQGLNVIPQLLTRDADEFVWAAGLLAERGFTEVNLNLGCPSGTVVSRGKGAGALADPEALEAFLQEICARSPLPVSVKTRVGVEADTEYERILAVYCRCPLAELIVHPRVRADAYNGKPRQELYGYTLETAPFPVAYNGDVFTCDDFDALLTAYPATRHVMLGRGLLADPSLAQRIGGGAPASREELRRFHDALFAAYETEMGGNAVMRMKEWWSYAKESFADSAAVWRAVRKARRVDEYRAVVERVFTMR
ncbi:tRNA-dihydrouridine synthase family protein [Paratractidigestivibacter sp.]|uniref:tRNA dihydrouridine synthase n=1 Tax=Paratractidigestivibacter sp. TaxID=2847316 RepID=UPI002AC96BBE|nr:tRNA-dihydrouridine synthase family protein [Paratractidigestivibacter sp.]